VRFFFIKGGGAATFSPPWLSWESLVCKEMGAVPNGREGLSVFSKGGAANLVSGEKPIKEDGGCGCLREDEDLGSPFSLFFGRLQGESFFRFRVFLLLAALSPCKIFSAPAPLNSPFIFTIAWYL